VVSTIEGWGIVEDNWGADVPLSSFLSQSRLAWFSSSAGGGIAI
jgi:hypothetical protein